MPLPKRSLTSSMKNEIEFVKKPVPERFRYQRYPWEKIKQGLPMIVRNRKLASIASSAYAAARRLGVRFTVRQIGKDVEVHYVGKAPKDS